MSTDPGACRREEEKYARQVPYRTTAAFHTRRLRGALGARQQHDGRYRDKTDRLLTEAISSVLSLHIFSQHFRPDLGAINVAVRIGGHAFRAARGGLVRSGLRIGNEGRDLAIARAADINPALPTGIAFGVRLRVGHVNDVISIDENAARTAELLPFLQELAVLIEELNPVVRAVADEEAAA